MVTKTEYITVEQARKQLSDEEFSAFNRWLREKGIINLSEVGENKYRHEIFATKDQLNQFVREQIRDFKGSNSLTHLYGQTREYLRGFKGKRK